MRKPLAPLGVTEGVDRKAPCHPERSEATVEFRSPEGSSTFLAAMIKCVSRVPAGRAKSET